MTFPYAEVFKLVEKKLEELISSSPDAPSKLASLGEFKRYPERILSDDEYFRLMVLVVFYSGFLAETVKSREATILGHFPDLATVLAYSDEDLSAIQRDKAMIRNARKIKACVDNARLMREVIERHGSFRAYLHSFGELESLEDLLLLKETLEAKFHYLGGITVYHFMTDAGLPVLKPDRVLTRIFHRLGLVEDEHQLLKTVLQGRKFAAAAGLPIRYVDIVFVLYGQVSATAYGVEQGICLLKPRCGSCGITEQLCNFRVSVRTVPEAQIAA